MELKVDLLPRATGWSRHLCLRLGLDKHGASAPEVSHPPLPSPWTAERPNFSPMPYPPVIPTENRTTLSEAEGDVRLSGGTPTLCPKPCRIREFFPLHFHLCFDNVCPSRLFPFSRMPPEPCAALRAATASSRQAVNYFSDFQVGLARVRGIGSAADPRGRQNG